MKRDSSMIDPCLLALSWPRAWRGRSLDDVSEESSNGDSSGQSGIFPETRWSLILQAQDDRSQCAQDALSDLCQLYWYPVYCFVRSRKFSPEDSEDLCQSFFQRLLSRQLFERAEARKGKLRAFLLNALKDHLVDSQRWNTAKKRGGDSVPVSLDQAQAEERYALEPMDHLAPDAIFDRTWASTLMNAALKELEEIYAGEGKQEFFAKIQVYMSGNDADGHARLAEELDMNPSTLRVAVHRMRKRFKAILKRSISETVDGSDEVSEEIKYLLGLFAN